MTKIMSLRPRFRITDTKILDSYSYEIESF